jgi:hypothetical protein
LHFLCCKSESAVSGAAIRIRLCFCTSVWEAILKDVIYALILGKRSSVVERADIEARNYDLKAVNPNAVHDEDTRTPAELLDAIEAHGREAAEALAALRKLTEAKGVK